jgi:DUF177 domain-containing protein
MRLDLRDLAPEGVRFHGPLELSDLPLEGDERVSVHEATIAGSAVPGTFGVDLRARLRARLELTCVRCLDPYETPVDLPFELILTGEPPPEADDAPDPATFYPIQDGIADLLAIAREQLYLALPLKPICAPTCRGLCPTCGVNRNRLECGCRNESVDPRLAPLLDLRKRLRDR